MVSSKPPLRSVVLVVEDEILLLMSAVDMIRDLGYEVLEASSVEEATRILDVRRDVRIVFTDIQMPGSMDGLELAALVCRRWPSIDVMVTSGVLQAKDLDLPTRCAFVPKPYSLSTVSALLRKFLSD